MAMWHQPSLASFSYSKAKITDQVGSYSGEVRALRAEVLDLRASNQALQDEILNVSMFYDQSQREHAAVQNELKRVQELDFESRAVVNTSYHEIISERFNAVFDAIGKWARDYFKSIDYKSVAAVSDLQKSLKWITWDDFDCKRISFRFLVEAVVADLITDEILLKPFNGCAKEFGDVNGRIYSSMLEAAREEENPINKLKLQAQAEKLRAISLSSYDSYGKRHGIAPGSPYPIHFYREKHHEHVVQRIMMTFSCCKSEASQRDPGEFTNRCKNFVKMAGELAVELGKLPARLECINKDWFDKAGRLFREQDDRMEDRWGSDDHDPSEQRMVNIVIRPGFLKYGNDAGENLDIYAVWIPTIVELDEPTIQEAQASSHTTDYEDPTRREAGYVGQDCEPTCDEQQQSSEKYYSPELDDDIEMISYKEVEESGILETRPKIPESTILSRLAAADTEPLRYGESTGSVVSPPSPTYADPHRRERSTFTNQN